MKKIITGLALCILFSNVNIEYTHSINKEDGAQQVISFVNSDETRFLENEIICLGNVMVVYYGNVISADKLVFNKLNRTIIAEGNVIIKDCRKNTYFCDSILLVRNFESGKIKNIQIILHDKSRLAADTCIIKNKKLELRNVIYTPCYECSKTGQLTWQIKATNVHFDQNEDVIYENASLESFGVPILYTPYMSHASINLKRKSGMLPPKFSSSSLSGFSILPQYLWCISPSQELIFKPIITTKIGAVAWGYYRHRIKNGEFSIDASITGIESVRKYSPKDEKEKEVIKKIKKSGYRGHIFSKLNYDINEIWRAKFDINLTSDRYYLKRFPFFHSIHDKFDKTLESSIKIEGFEDRNYTSVKSSIFQSEYTDYIPKIFPVIEHSYSRRILDGTLNINTIFMNIIFHQNESIIEPGSETSRMGQKITSNVSWNKKLMLPHGQILDLNGLVSLGVLGKFRGKEFQNPARVKATPQLNINWKWPVLVSMNTLKTIVTPIFGMILANGKKYSDPLDDPFREISDVNLFDGSRSISSYNIDSGSRMCYGLKVAAYRNNGKNLGNFMIGRSRELSSAIKEHAEVSGLKYKNSNIVSTAEIFLNDDWKFLSNGSYSSKDKRWTRFTSGIKCTKKPFDFEAMVFDGKQSSFDPFKIDDHLVTNTDKIQKYKGIMFDMGYQMSKTLKFKGGIVLGDKNNKLIKHQIGVLYKNECTTIEASIARTSYRGGDLKPETSFRLVIHLKNIGG